MKLFIGCSSRNEIPKKYIKSCKDYLDYLFDYDNDLIFGADSRGIMGVCYDIAKSKKRKIIGVTPEAFKKDSEGLEYDELIFTENISERTYKVISMCDALVFLPGGIGSIYEFFSSLEFIRSGEFNKPIVIYNSDHYYDNMLEMLEKIYEEKFADNNLFYHVSYDAKDTLEYINNYYI